MRVVIFGSTGGTGRPLVEGALALGHEVTAFARDPSDVSARHERLEVLQGDVLRPETVGRAVAGRDGVISALGTRLLQKGAVLSEGTRNIIGAMKEHGARRLVCMSSLGVGDSRGQVGFIFGRVIVPLLLREMFFDKERQEEEVRQSGLDWIILRPATLTNSRPRGAYRVGTDRSLRGGKISRADTAHFMLRQLTDDSYLRQTVTITY